MYQFLKELFKAQMVISGTSPHFRHSNLVSRIIIYIKHQNKVSIKKVKKGIEIKLTLADPGWIKSFERTGALVFPGETTGNAGWAFR